MTLLERLSECNKRIKRLRDENYQLRKSRDMWKETCRGKAWENQELRRSVKRLRAQRDRWKSGQRPRSRPAEWSNIRLSSRDVERILEMPVRR